MVYEQENGHYVVCYEHEWRPGAYTSERAAYYSYNFTDDDLSRLCESMCGPIDLETLVRLYHQKKALAWLT